MTEPLLQVRNLVQHFSLRGSVTGQHEVVQAVSDISFNLKSGETLGIVGETGSGKSTLARSLLQIPGPKSGAVIFQGHDLTKLNGRELLRHRHQMQMVFQDPFGSLNPKWQVSSIIEEPLINFKSGNKRQRKEKVETVLELIGLPLSIYGNRKPKELSGGQCQRIAIARSIVLDPKLIICDEAVSSLDLLIQAQILNLFEKLRLELGLSYLFISHDLALVKHISDSVAILHVGQLCEIGSTESLFRNPQHPYTVALFASIPGSTPGKKSRIRIKDIISGEPPSPVNPPSGCRFRTRCHRARQICSIEKPELQNVNDTHQVACHFPISHSGSHQN